MNKKAVVIAMPDPMERRRLSSLVNTLPDFHALRRTADLMETYTEVELLLPKAVLIDERLAALPEFEVMRALFSTLDVRWLVVEHGSGQRLQRQPVTPHRSDLFAIPASAPPAVFEAQLRSLTRSNAAREEGPKTPRPLKSAAGQSRVILIGASTGGVDALLCVLSQFGADCPPTVVVQHTGAGFGKSLANLLDRQCRATVVLADSDHGLNTGQIIVGAGTNSHVILKPGAPARVVLEKGTAVSGHMPSVDRLFESAVPMAPNVVAALLTGMGRDGARGLKALRDAGARTIAQDQASCVVYGMPRAAAELGAADAILPLDKIGTALLSAPASAHPRPNMSNVQ